MKVKDLVTTSIFTCLISVGAFIHIPGPFVPLTLQVFFVILSALFLKPKYSFLSVLLYIIIGLIGFPIFTKGGGIAYVLQPTFGYIIGFLIAAPIISIFIKKRNLYLSSFFGILVIYFIGVIYFYIITRYVLDSDLSIYLILLNTLILPLPNDILSLFIACKIYKRLNK